MNEYVPSAKIKAAIKTFEGLRLTVYSDTAGFATIGNGHKLKRGETLTSITLEQANSLFDVDVADTVNQFLPLIQVKLNQNQLDAILDFCFNLGVERFKTSTMLKMINQGDLDGAAKQFQLWVNVAGKVSTGLVKRRAFEATLFQTPC
jgi:lysozyme